MRTHPLAVLALCALAPLPSLSQASDADIALQRALEAAAELAHATARSGDGGLTATAERARDALNAAVAALRAQPLCRPLRAVDSVTFDFLVEELRRGNRTGTVPHRALAPTLERHAVTVAQLRRLLELVPGASARLDLVRLAANRLIDPEAGSELYALFPLKTDQRELAFVLAR